MVKVPLDGTGTEETSSWGISQLPRRRQQETTVLHMSLYHWRRARVKLHCLRAGHACAACLQNEHNNSATSRGSAQGPLVEG